MNKCNSAWIWLSIALGVFTACFGNKNTTAETEEKVIFTVLLDANNEVTLQVLKKKD